MSANLRQAVSWVMAERGLQMLMMLLIAAVLARTYGPVGLATFQTYLSLAAVFASIGFLCSAEVLIPRYQAEHPRYGLVFEYAFLLRLMAALVAGSAYLLYVYQAFPENPALALGLLPIVVIHEPVAAFGVYFQTVGQQRVWSVIRLTWLLAKVALVLLIAGLGLPLGWVGLPYAVEALGAAVMLMRRYGYDAIRPMWRWDPALLRELLSHGVGMGLGLVAMATLQRLDRLHLAAVGALETLGQYAAGIQIAEAWFFCAFLIVQAIAARHVFALTGRARLQRIVAVAGVFGTVATVAWLMGSVLAPWAIPWLYGAEFGDTVSWLRWQLGLAIVVWLEAALGLTLLGQKATLWITAKWGGALLVAYVMANVPWPGVPAPLQIPLSGYAFACLFSLVYTLGGWRRWSRTGPSAEHDS